MHWQTYKPSKNPVDMEVNTEQLSATSLRMQFSAYQSMVRDLYDQNTHNAELLGSLKTQVLEKEFEISRL